MFAQFGQVFFTNTCKQNIADFNKVMANGVDKKWRVMTKLDDCATGVGFSLSRV